MPDTPLPRRRFLGYLASGLASAGPLAACGGGAPPPETTPARAKVLMSFLDYQAGNQVAQTSTLEQELTGLTPVPDRFDTGSYCHSFTSDGSHAVARTPPALGGSDFAVSFWICTSSAQRMRVLTLATPAGPALGVDINGAPAISVSCNATNTTELSYGGSGELADGSWHFILVQRVGALIQLFVDGAARGSITPEPALAPFSSIQLGGWDELPWQGCIDDLRLHNRAFGAAEIMPMVYRWTQVKPNNRADAVAAYYPFNGDAVNSTGKGLDGRLTNVQPMSDRFGNSDSAFRFNGIDSCIELQGSFYPPPNNYAIAFWLRSSSPARMTALSVSPGESDIAFVFNDGLGLKLVIDGSASAPIGVGFSGEFTDDRWHYVLMQRTGASLELYVDAVLRGVSDLPLKPYGPGSVVRVGRSSGVFDHDASFWSGGIDDLQIYERSFTAREVKDLQVLQFRPRDGAGALTFANRMWLLGGWNPDDAQVTNSEVWCSPDGFNWSFVKHAPWEGRHTAGCLVFNDRLWIIGGDKNRGHYQNDVWSSADGEHWDFVTDQVPWADRATHYTLTFNNRMWLMGGQQVFSPNGQVIAYNDVYSSADGRDWRLETAQAQWCPRGLILGSVVFRGRMWVIGGGTYDVRTYQNDVWSSSDGVQWNLVVEKAPWSPRQYHSVTVFDNKIWVVGGADTDSRGGTNDVWCSADGVTWTQLDNSPWIARHATSVFSHQQSLWVVAGSSTAVYNDVWMLGYAP